MWKVLQSMDVCICNAFSLDKRTHRYLIEPISGCLHPKVLLARRYVSFTNSLKVSNKLGFRILYSLSSRDLWTVMGGTLTKIMRECKTNMDYLTANIVKKKMSYSVAPESESWRVVMVSELIDENMDVPGFSEEKSETCWPMHALSKSIL